MAAECIRDVRGTALPLRGDNIDTDRIIPARFLRSITFEGLDRHLFEDDRAALAAQGKRHPIENEAFRTASILLVNGNFGCGSSREHAPQAIRRRGFEAIIGESFSEIFFGNAVALGMPCVTADRAVLDALMRAAEQDPATIFRLDVDAQTIALAGGPAMPVNLPAAARSAFLDGSWDATGLLLEDFAEVEAVASRLPYVSGWRTI